MKSSVFFMFFSVAHCSQVIFEDDHMFEGSACKTKYGAEGICRLVLDCPYELHVIKYFPPDSRNPICTFNGSQPIVCCAEPSRRPSQKACESQRQYTVGVVRPFNGKEARRQTHPHVVALGYRNAENKYDWVCGGSLITQFYVLTAAHCVANPYRGGPDVIWAGVHNLSSTEGEVVPVERFILHPLYNASSHYHDIALLKVNVTLGNNVKPACLPSTLEDPTFVDVLGWGATDIDGTLPTNIIQLVELKEVSMERCNESYAGRSFVFGKLARGIVGTQICAEGADGLADSCSGDSGGPLQEISTTYRKFIGLNQRSSEIVVYGITSFGKPQFCSSIGVYTRVASYLDWIESIAWPSDIV